MSVQDLNTTESVTCLGQSESASDTCLGLENKREEVLQIGLEDFQTFRTNTDSQTLRDTQDSQTLTDSEDTHWSANSDVPDQTATLTDYLVEAWVFTSDEHESRSYQNGWQSPMFGFARLAKAHPELAKLDSADALEAVHAVLDQNDIDMDDEKDIDFMTCWTAIRCPLGDIIEAAKTAAEQRPLKPRKRRGSLYGPFLSLARTLQAMMPDRNILLPCERLAKCFDCSPRMIAALRQFAIEDGYIREVKKHDLAKREATQFRFNTGDHTSD